MSTILEIVGSLEAAGLIALFTAICVKFATGVAASVSEGKFEWSHFGDVLKNDLLKYVTVLVLVYLYQEPAIITPVMSVFALDLATGVARNVGRLFPSVADKLPNTVISTDTRRAVEDDVRIVEK